MASGYQIGTKSERVVEKRLELDFPVTKDIGVGGSPGAILIKEMLEYIVPVFSGKVSAV